MVTNHMLPNLNSSLAAQDAAGEDWFGDLRATGAAFASPEGHAVIADVRKFLDITRFELLVVEEDDIPLVIGTAAAPVG